MKVVLSPEASNRLESQIAYLRDAGAEVAAEALRMRVMPFLSKHINRFPRIGRWLHDCNLWEMWIPGSRIVLWYRIESNHIEIVTAWHTAQNRSAAKK